MTRIRITDNASDMEAKASMISALVEQSLRRPFPTEWVRARQREIERRVLAESSELRDSNFSALHIDDLWRIFQLYDAAFFQGAVSAELVRTKSQLGFRLGTRLTSAGAKTTWFRRKGHSRLEIAVSTRLLNDSFSSPGATHWVAGLLCTSRLQALQRLMEHELIHVAELLVFGDSRCGRRRFKTMAASLFRHAKSHHQLTRPNDRIRAIHGFQVGDLVAFVHKNRPLQGRLRRITVRATVLVPDPRGQAYSDGGRYAKFWVPLDQLTLVEPHRKAIAV